MSKLGKWLEARQKKCKTLINRVHKMIVAVTLAEQDVRKKIHTIQRAIRGYDMFKWTEADAIVGDESHLEVDYQEVKFITPTKGNHRFAQWQRLYEDVQ